MPRTRRRMESSLIGRSCDIRIVFHSSLCGDHVLYAPCDCEFVFDPGVGDREAFLEGNARFPSKHLAQQAIVAVPSSDALRLAEIMISGELFAGNSADEVDQSIDTDQAISAEVQRANVVRPHPANQTFEAIVHAHEPARLPAISPDLAGPLITCQPNFAANCGWGFFLAASVS